MRSSDQPSFALYEGGSEENKPLRVSVSTYLLVIEGASEVARIDPNFALDVFSVRKRPVGKAI